MNERLRNNLFDLSNFLLFPSIYVNNKLFQFHLRFDESFWYFGHFHSISSKNAYNFINKTNTKLKQQKVFKICQCQCQFIKIGIKKICWTRQKNTRHFVLNPMRWKPNNLHTKIETNCDWIPWNLVWRSSDQMVFSRFVTIFKRLSVIFNL